MTDVERLVELIDELQQEINLSHKSLAEALRDQPNKHILAATKRLCLAAGIQPYGLVEHYTTEVPKYGP